MTRSYRDLHVGLTSAAAMAYAQLEARDRPPAFYDVEHFSEVLNRVAHALARAATIHVRDEAGNRRALTEAELRGLRIRRGATRLELADGTCLSGATIARGDLRDAIAILKAAGLRSFAPDERAGEPRDVKPQDG